jgi:hypothetical protein
MQNPAFQQSVLAGWRNPALPERQAKGKINGLEDIRPDAMEVLFWRNAIAFYLPVNQ